MLKLISISFLITMLSCKEPVKVEDIKSEVKDVSQMVQKVADTSKMVYFDGGTIIIGSNNGLPNEQPAFEMTVKPFYLDKNLVTVAEFRSFVNSANYRTDADKFGDSGVYSFEKGTWELLPETNWEFPLGKQNSKAFDNHPVTHVSWNDAKAYATFMGKRLPTEFEWEFAAKNGQNSTDKYAWGNSLQINGKYMANVWEGKNINESEPLDGFLRTSAVGEFGILKSGLTDMGGNVWQWCENYFKAYPENENSAPEDPAVRSTRGGSFMFDEALEKSYTVTFRGKNSTDTSLFNMGFRCAK